MERFTHAGLDDTAAAAQECVGKAQIGAHPAFMTIKAGETIGQEEAGAVKVERDRILIADLVEIARKMSAAMLYESSYSEALVSWPALRGLRA